MTERSTTIRPKTEQMKRVYSSQESASSNTFHRSFWEFASTGLTCETDKSAWQEYMPPCTDTQTQVWLSLRRFTDRIYYRA